MRAGLWERWDPGEGAIESCTILTTAPNELIRPIHNRMPVILSADAYGPWLNSPTPVTERKAIRMPYWKDDLPAVAVGQRVNNPENDDIGCIEAV